MSTLCRLASIPYDGLVSHDEIDQPALPAELRRCHATNIAFDIAGFGRRDSFAQVTIRHEMYRILRKTFAESGVTWPRPPAGWAEDRGDGALFVIASPVPAQHDIDLLMLYLAAELRRHNRAASVNTQINLRMAINFGQVLPDGDGLGGKAIVTLFRLLDACAFKEAATAVDATLGVIVSHDFYIDEIEPGWGLLDPGSYRSLAVANKETSTHAWFTFQR